MNLDNASGLKVQLAVRAQFPISNTTESRSVRLSMYVPLGLGPFLVGMSALGQQRTYAPESPNVRRNRERTALPG